MDLEQKLQTKIAELEGLRGQMVDLDKTRQKLTIQIFELQGAVRMLMELVNEQKAVKS